MKIDPQQAHRNLYFYNNICLIVVCFSILCFLTSFFLGIQISKKTYLTSNNSIFGPIEITKNNQIYVIHTKLYQNNTSSTFSGSVLDENKDVLYEFEKDLWHESGYDGGEYWVESDNSVNIPLTFAKRGTYYIEFDNFNPNTTKAYIAKKYFSDIPHLKFGAILLLITLFTWIIINFEWVKNKLGEMEDNIEYD